MRYLKTLLVSLLAFIGVSSFATSMTSAPVKNGVYRLYNVGKGQYFTKGNGWGTQASVTTSGNPDDALVVALNKINGKYQIRTDVNGGYNGLEHLSGGTMYTDQSRNKYSTWTFTQVGDDDGPIYNIISADNHGGGAGAYMTANADNTIVGPGSDGEDPYAQWKLELVPFSKDNNDEIIASMASVDMNSPLDVTALIWDANFNEKDLWVSLWNMESSNRNLQGGASANPCGESWRAAFTLSQQVNGLGFHDGIVPNGRYELKAQAALTDYLAKDNEGWGKNWPVIYANDVTSEFPLMTEGENSMSWMSNQFTAGKYEVAPVVVDVTDNALIVGARGTRNNTWAIFDNFRLTFYGNEPILKDLIAKANALMSEVDETNAAMLAEAIEEAEGYLGTTDQAALEDAIAELQDVYNTANALNIAKTLAVNVLNDVPAALFPENFKWNLREGEHWEEINGKEQMELTRKYKVYKNNAGRYKLASRIGVATLIDLLELADAVDDETIQLIYDDMGEQEYNAWALYYYGNENEYNNKSFEKFEEAYYGTLAEMLTNMARFVVETHGEGAALFEQNDPNYSRMYDAASEAGYNQITLAYYWFYYYGFDVRWYFDVEPTLSDTYEMIHKFYGGSFYDYSELGFDNTFTAHITNPKFENGLAGWTEEFAPANVLTHSIADNEPLTDCTGENAYAYYDINNWGNETTGFSANVYQQIQLPAGRYMLTMAGRCSAPNIGDNDGDGIPDYLTGAFTDPSAAENNKFLRVYAVNCNGIEVAQSVMPQIGSADVVESEYWNNVHAVPGWNNYSVFGNGWNDASVFFTMPTLGTATVGLKVATPVGKKDNVSFWASATNFRLTRLGDATIYLDENKSMPEEFNFDVVNWLGDGFAPTDMLLHKEMKAGQWYSITMPADVPYDQIIGQFGEGTLLAQPVAVEDYNEDGTEKLVYFWEWDPYYDYAFGWDKLMGNSIDGMLANVPYLIKPAQVKTSNLYLFKGLYNTEKKAPADCVWSWGAVSLNPDSEDFLQLFEYDEDGIPTSYSFAWMSDEQSIRFIPNYTYVKDFSDQFQIEFDGRMKSFQGLFDADGVDIVGAILIGEDEDGNLAMNDDWADIFLSQFIDAVELGKTVAEQNPGIPAALTKMITTMPDTESLSVADIIEYLKEMKSAIREAKKAYEPSKQFNALMAEAEEMLASEHVELVAGIDNQFRRILDAMQIKFDRLTSAEEVVALIATLQAAVDDYCTKVKFGGIKEGKNYLRNVATGKYLGSGNNWGCQASLVKHPEYVKLAQISDGVYTIETQVYNGSEGQIYLGVPNNNDGIFMDTKQAFNVTFVPVGEYYVMSVTANLNNGEVLNGILSSEDGETISYGTEEDENALWEVISEANMMLELADATVEDPKDATFLVKDANFSRGNVDASAWVFETENHNISGANENFCAESWMHTFTMTQVVELPNGVYRVDAQAALTDYTDKYDGFDYPVVFANDQTTPFMEMDSEDRSTSMSQLSKSFLAGKYQVKPIVVKVTDGKLSLGTRGTRTDTWAIWDNFELTYYGADAAVEDVQTAVAAGGESTGINEVNTSILDQKIYNLNGVRMNNAAQKGVYIINGKKVVK